MSSAIDRSGSPTATPANGQAASRIIHFDATVRRKEKMRHRATGEGPAQGNGYDGGGAGEAPVNEAASTQSPSAPAQPPAGQPAPAQPQSAAAAPPSPTPSGSTGSSKPGSPAAKRGMSGEELERFLIGFVVEQTGYPDEMVELDADLEADLGIDSIKKAQLFGELAEQFDVDVQGAEELSLDDFPTLRHVVSFLEGASGTASAGEQSAQAESDAAAAAAAARTAATAGPPQTTEPTAAPAPETGSPARAAEAAPADQGDSPDPSGMSGEELERFLIGFVVEQTGYPEEMVELEADLEADLGIDSIKKAQLFGELAERFQIDVQGSENLSLDDFPTLRHVVEFLQDAVPAGKAEEAAGPRATETSPPPSQPAPPASTSPAGPVSGASQSAASPSAPEAGGGETTTPGGTPTGGAALSGPELERFLIDFVVEQTGYPDEMVELDADLEADLGIDSIKKAQLFGELAEHFEVDIQGAQDLSLDDFPTLRHVMRFLEGVPQKAPA